LNTRSFTTTVSGAAKSPTALAVEVKVFGMAPVEVERVERDGHRVQRPLVTERNSKRPSSRR
jgi:hypothetical protein